MIARERPLCDWPDWWHEFPAEAVEKGHDYGVAGLDRGHEVSYRSGRFSRLRPRPGLQRGTAP